MSLSDPALYLAFRLGGEVYAIDILRIREIVEYSAPASVPLMPSAAMSTRPFSPSAAQSSRWAFVKAAGSAMATYL